MLGDSLLGCAVHREGCVHVDGLGNEWLHNGCPWYKGVVEAKTKIYQHVEAITSSYRVVSWWVLPKPRAGIKRNSRAKMFL